MTSRGCLHPTDAFCNVCGQFIKTRARKYFVKACCKKCEAYNAYFGMPVGDEDKSWAPHFTCEYCNKTLGVPHCPELPVPTPSKRDQPSSGKISKSDSEEDIGDQDYVFTDAAEERRPYFPNQKDVNDLIRDLHLTKSNAELLTSRLKQWNLLVESLQITDQRKRQQTFSNFFIREDGLCFCNNVAGHFEAIGITCNPSEWRLFIDSSSRSLKAVLLHNGNNYPSLPMANSVYLKEEYTSVKMLLSALKSDNCGSEVIGDFKMVSFLMGLQGSFTKCPCFLCLWDSRDTKVHYHRKDWPQRTEFSVGKSNVKWEPLIEPLKVLMPPLHIKLGLIKQFATALDKESAAFKYLQDLFPKLSEAKVKAGIFVGPQIKKIIECDEFAKLLNREEKTAWSSFVAEVHGFLRNHKAVNSALLVQTLIKNYGIKGWRLSLKFHILDAHLDKFKENMGAYSEEQGEDQDILDFECRYQGQYNENKMGDYIWVLLRESDLQYTRKSRKPTPF
ncbi:uncharacterized protein [Phyllobates terribilis]|uniref:uncharacterized protein n=1 Tax=Phyllobates terribilis TaxID=111132 RepID=UPI003CCAB06C